MRRVIFLAVVVCACASIAAQQYEVYVPQVVAGRDPVSGLYLQTTFYMWNQSDTEVEAQIG